MYVRVPTSDFRHVQDKYADLIQEALDSLNMDYQDVQFVTPKMIRLRHLSGTMADCRLRLRGLRALLQLQVFLRHRLVLIGMAPRN
jgi:hypothetical protein